MSEEQQPPHFFSLMSPAARLWLLFILWLSCGLVFMALSRVPGLNLSSADPAAITPFQLRLSQVISGILVFAVPAFVYANAFSKKGIGWLGIYRSPGWKFYVLVILTMLAAYAGVLWLGELNDSLIPDVASDKEVESLTRRMLAMNNISDLLMNLFALAFIPALCEELFFRGGVLGILLEWVKNKHAAVWITAAIFSFLHFHFAAFIPRFILGAMLGYFCIWSRSIWPSVAAHFAYNAIQLIIYYLESHHIVDFGYYVLPVIALVSVLLSSGGFYLSRRYMIGYEIEDDERTGTPEENRKT